MESPSVPASRSATADASLVVIAIVVVGAAITHLGPVLQPFLVALFLFYATRFGVKTLSGLGMRPLTAYVTLVGLILIASVLLAQFVYREAVSFRGSWPRYEDRIGDIITAWSGPLGGAADAGENVPLDEGAVEPTAARTSLSDLFRVSSRDVLNFVFAKGRDAAELIVLVFCYLVFLFLGSRKFEARVGRAFPGERGKRILAVGEGISESMERFMMVKSVIGVGMGLSAGLIMWLFDLDHWPLWAFLFFAANYITSIGSWAACVPPILIAALDLGAVPATILAILVVVNRIFWIDFLELKLSGKQLNLDPTILFLWLSYWGWAWGILGLILAYPMMAAVKISLRHLSGAHGWDELLSDE